MKPEARPEGIKTVMLYEYLPYRNSQ